MQMDASDANYNYNLNFNLNLNFNFNSNLKPSPGPCGPPRRGPRARTERRNCLCPW